MASEIVKWSIFKTKTNKQKKHRKSIGANSEKMRPYTHRYADFEGDKSRIKKRWTCGKSSTYAPP